MRDWLRSIRKINGLTEAAVAEKCGIKQPSYHRIEAGQQGVKVSTAKAIASVLGFDWRLFYTDGNEKEASA